MPERVRVACACAWARTAGPGTGPDGSGAVRGFGSLFLRWLLVLCYVGIEVWVAKCSGERFGWRPVGVGLAVSEASQGGT